MRNSTNYRYIQFLKEYIYIYISEKLKCSNNTGNFIIWYDMTYLSWRGNNRLKVLLQSHTKKYNLLLFS